MKRDNNCIKCNWKENGFLLTFTREDGTEHTHPEPITIRINLEIIQLAQSAHELLKKGHYHSCESLLEELCKRLEGDR